MKFHQKLNLIGAVNTVTNKDGKGHLVGYNTDGIGAIKALEDEGVTVKDQSITLTGAGGAATAIAIQAAFDGAKELYIFNINDDVFENAKETAKKSMIILTVGNCNRFSRFKQTLNLSHPKK